MKAKVLKVATFVSFVAFGLCSFNSCAKEHVKTEDEVLETLIEPTVMITAGEYRGSGVIIENSEDRIVIATVAHLMSGYDQGIVSFYSGKVGFADVFCCDDASDICLMKINKSDMDKTFADSLKSAEINLSGYENLKEDDLIYLVGSSVSVAGNIMRGSFKAFDYYVPEFDEYLMYLYCDAFEGMSGAGCYDGLGNLVGFVTAASESGEVLCIPVKDYLEKMEEER